MKKLFYFAAALPVLLVAFCLSSCDVIGGKNSGNGNDPGEGDEPGIVDETPVFVINNTLEGDWFMARRYMVTAVENGEDVISNVQTFDYGLPKNGAARYVYKSKGDNRYGFTMYYWFTERHGQSSYIRWCEIMPVSPEFEFVGGKMIDTATGKEVDYVISQCDKDRMLLVQKYSDVETGYYEFIRTPELPVISVSDALATETGRLVRVKGECRNVRGSSLTSNWDLSDESGEIYVYGTLDAAYQFTTLPVLNISEGDIVTVEGYRYDYGDVKELYNVSIISVEK